MKEQMYKAATKKRVIGPAGLSGLPAHQNSGAHQRLSGGQTLDEVTQTRMSARFGHDFSQVRIHTDARAEESAETMGARAFTQGHDIVFGQGKYAPGSREGDRLLAHELTHVVQQDRFGPGDWGRMSRRNEASEQEADSLAGQVMMGQTVQVQSAPGAAIARDEDETCRQIGPPAPQKTDDDSATSGWGISSGGWWAIQKAIEFAAKKATGAPGIPGVNPMSAPFSASSDRSPEGEREYQEQQARERALNEQEWRESAQREQANDADTSLTIQQARDETMMDSLANRGYSY